LLANLPSLVVEHGRPQITLLMHRTGIVVVPLVLASTRSPLKMWRTKELKEIPP